MPARLTCLALTALAISCVLSLLTALVELSCMGRRGAKEHFRLAPTPVGDASMGPPLLPIGCKHIRVILALLHTLGCETGAQMWVEYMLPLGGYELWV